MKTIKNHTLLIVLCLALGSCAVPVSYIGDKLPPTTSVDIYYSAHDVTKSYKVIGHMSYANIGTDQLKAKFQQFAKTIGADGVIISGTEASKNDAQASVDADAIKYQ